MAKRTHREDQDKAQPGSFGFSDTLKAIEAQASQDARAPLDSERAVLLFLKSWWSRTYNRPLKDPLLSDYTIEELLYEFYDKIERAKAAEETIDKESDKIEENKEKEVLDWAEAEEKKELEELAKKGQPESAELEENKQWMEEQLKAQKELHGDDFGEDIDFNNE